VEKLFSTQDGSRPLTLKTGQRLMFDSSKDKHETDSQVRQDLAKARSLYYSIDPRLRPVTEVSLSYYKRLPWSEISLVALPLWAVTPFSRNGEMEII